MPELANVGDLDSTPHAEVFERRRPRTVRLSLDAGENVPPHTHPGSDVVLHLLSGRLELTLDGRRTTSNPAIWSGSAATARCRRGPSNRARP